MSSQSSLQVSDESTLRLLSSPGSGLSQATAASSQVPAAPVVIVNDDGEMSEESSTSSSDAQMPAANRAGSRRGRRSAKREDTPTGKRETSKGPKSSSAATIRKGTKVRASSSDVPMRRLKDKEKPGNPNEELDPLIRGRLTPSWSGVKGNHQVPPAPKPNLTPKARDDDGKPTMPTLGMKPKGVDPSASHAVVVSSGGDYSRKAESLSPSYGPMPRPASLRGMSDPKNRSKERSPSYQLTPRQKVLKDSTEPVGQKGSLQDSRKAAEISADEKLSQMIEEKRKEQAAAAAAAAAAQGATQIVAPGQPSSSQALARPMPQGNPVVYDPNAADTYMLQMQNKELQKAMAMQESEMNRWKEYAQNEFEFHQQEHVKAMHSYRQTYLGQVQELRDQTLLAVERSEREKQNLSMQNAGLEKEAQQRAERLHELEMVATNEVQVLKTRAENEQIAALKAISDASKVTDVAIGQQQHSNRIKEVAQQELAAQQAQLQATAAHYQQMLSEYQSQVGLMQQEREKERLLWEDQVKSSNEQAKRREQELGQGIEEMKAQLQMAQAREQEAAASNFRAQKELMDKCHMALEEAQQKSNQDIQNAESAAAKAAKEHMESQTKSLNRQLEQEARHSAMLRHELDELKEMFKARMNFQQPPPK